MKLSLIRGFPKMSLSELRDDVSLPVPLRTVRSVLVGPGDLRNEIGLQNEINGLLAALAGDTFPWIAEAPLFTTPPVSVTPVYALPRRAFLPDDDDDTDAEIPAFRVAVAR